MPLHSGSSRVWTGLLAPGLLLLPLTLALAASGEDAQAPAGSGAKQAKETTRSTEAAPEKKAEPEGSKAPADASLKTLEDLYCSREDAAALLTVRQPTPAARPVQWREVP